MNIFPVKEVKAILLVTFLLLCENAMTQTTDGRKFWGTYGSRGMRVHHSKEA